MNWNIKFNFLTSLFSKAVAVWLCKILLTSLSMTALPACTGSQQRFVIAAIESKYTCKL